MQRDATLVQIQLFYFAPPPKAASACVIIGFAPPVFSFHDLLVGWAEYEETRFTIDELDVSIVRVGILYPRTGVNDVFCFVNEGNMRMAEDENLAGLNLPKYFKGFRPNVALV